MNIKANEIQLFLNDFEKNLINNVRCNSSNDKFIIDLMISECKKARNALNLLNWLAEESDFNKLPTITSPDRKKEITSQIK